jgi:hypothetical protein
VWYSLDHGRLANLRSALDSQPSAEQHLHGS